VSIELVDVNLSTVKGQILEHDGEEGASQCKEISALNRELLTIFNLRSAVSLSANQVFDEFVDFLRVPEIDQDNSEVIS
jgi:hypothetical protein